MGRGVEEYTEAKAAEQKYTFLLTRSALDLMDGVTSKDNDSLIEESLKKAVQHYLNAITLGYQITLEQDPDTFQFLVDCKETIAQIICDMVDRKKKLDILNQAINPKTTLGKIFWKHRGGWGRFFSKKPATVSLLERELQTLEKLMKTNGAELQTLSY